MIIFVIGVIARFFDDAQAPGQDKSELSLQAWTSREISRWKFHSRIFRENFISLTMKFWLIWYLWLAWCLFDTVKITSLTLFNKYFLELLIEKLYETCKFLVWCVMKSINEPTMMKTTWIFFKKSYDNPWSYFETSALTIPSFQKMFLQNKDTYFLNSQESIKIQTLRKILANFFQD